MHFILHSPCFVTTDNQYGFEPQHVTDMCVFLLKQTISYWVNKEILSF